MARSARGGRASHHDYKRHGTTTRFAALDILSGKVIGQCMLKHRAVEFVRFLRRIDKTTPPQLDLHLVLDNYAAHKAPAVKRWLERHPRFHLHFTPTSSSWLNMIERWFGKLTDKAIRRGVFHSVPELTAAIEAYLEANNQNPQPFLLTATADQILEKVRRGRVALDAITT